LHGNQHSAQRDLDLCKQAIAVVGATPSWRSRESSNSGAAIATRSTAAAAPLPAGVLQVVVEEARQGPPLLAKSAWPGPRRCQRARGKRGLEGGPERGVGLLCLRVEDHEIAEADLTPALQCNPTQPAGLGRVGVHRHAPARAHGGAGHVYTAAARLRRSAARRDRQGERRRTVATRGAAPATHCRTASTGRVMASV
jgi:hypothetical protein